MYIKKNVSGNVGHRMAYNDNLFLNLIQNAPRYKKMLHWAPQIVLPIPHRTYSYNTSLMSSNEEESHSYR